MIVYNTHFGGITCAEDQLVRFPDGLMGKRECTRWLVVDDAQTAPLRWLVSADDPALALPVMDPAVVLDADAKRTPASNEAATFVVATRGEGSVTWWLDLRHPIIIRPAARLGEQVTLDDAALPDRFPVDVQTAE